VIEAELPLRVFRIGRSPDPWAWPDWSFCGADGTFGNRFDDPEGVYRVLYASTERLATFVECLAYYRPDPEVFAEYERIDGSSDDQAWPPVYGVVPSEWARSRLVGTGRPQGRFVQLGHHESLAALRSALAGRVVHYGIGDLDAAAVRLSVPRAFTQEISRYVFEQTVDGHRHWDGICYQSRHGDDLQNWAFFEPSSPAEQTSAPFRANDPDLAAALSLHRLTLG
jgi:hypothetical protein